MAKQGRASSQQTSPTADIRVRRVTSNTSTSVLPTSQASTTDENITTRLIYDRLMQDERTLLLYSNRIGVLEKNSYSETNSFIAIRRLANWSLFAVLLALILLPLSIALFIVIFMFIKDPSSENSAVFWGLVGLVGLSTIADAICVPRYVKSLKDRINTLEDFKKQIEKDLYP